MVGVMFVALHGVRPVVRQLRIDPPMQRAHQFGAVRGKLNLPAIGHVLVPDHNLARFGLLKLDQPRHLRAVNVTGSGEVAMLELRRDFFQVLTNQVDLLIVLRIFHDDLLNAPAGGLSKHVRRCAQAERHDIRTAGRNFRLSFRVRRDHQAKLTLRMSFAVARPLEFIADRPLAARKSTRRSNRRIRGQPSACPRWQRCLELPGYVTGIVTLYITNAAS